MMLKTRKIGLVAIVLIIPFLSACGALAQRISGTDPALEEKTVELEVSLEPGEGIGGGALEPADIGTAIQLTLEAALGETPTPEPTNTAPAPSPTPDASATVPGIQFTQLANTLTAIAAPTITATPSPTDTEDEEADPTAEGTLTTPTPTAATTQGSVTPTLNPTQAVFAQNPCLALRFIADVNIPDGTPVQPGSTLFKSWYVQNVGSCRWTPSFKLVYQSGAAMGARDTYDLGTFVNPGQYVTLTAQMTSPSSPGYHTSYWGLTDENGNFFGWSADNNTTFDQPFYILVFVLGASQSNPGGGSGQPGVVVTAPPFTPGP